MTTTHLKKNHQAYLEREKELVEAHLGKVALFSEGELIEIYPDSDEAYNAGCEKFGLGHFSLEIIGQEPVSLGILTINIHSGD